IRIFDWSPRRNVWEESNSRALPNFYTVTALSWRKDGSRLVVGGLCGAVEQFETILRRTLVRGSHEVAYVGPSQVVIRSLDGKSRPVVLKSHSASEIEDVKVMGRADNHVVARTASSLIVADIERNLLSEISWEDRGGNEKFYFEYPGVCLVFSLGELTLIEYGLNEVLGSVRTEMINPRVASVRVNERRLAGQPDNKRLAYLLDPRTVRVLDLVTDATVALIAHTARVDWLQLNETGRRLLSKDQRGRLWLSDDHGMHTLLLSGTTFVSWIPGSDVVVAQSGSNVAVWYNIDAPDSPNLIPVRGESVGVSRANGRTSLLVDEGGAEVAYQLDEGLIEFGTALHDNDFGRVLLFLEELADAPQTEAMWENVANNAMSERSLTVAARCYAALGDVACARLLKEIVQIGERYAMETGNEPLASPDCWARLAILRGELKTAEVIYLEQNELGKALEMYQRYWHWEDALTLAHTRRWSGLAQLRDKHLSWLMDSGQTAKAASIIEPENPRRALKLYLDAKRPARAARLLLSQDELASDEKLVAELLRALKASELLELAAEVHERVGETHAAIENYAKAGIYARALELARKTEPNSVVQLEKDWGHHLMSSGHYDAAINHFIEAGETPLALKAAVLAHQWKKALQILQVIELDDDPELRNLCEKVAEHLASSNELAQAEQLFLRAGQARRAVDAYAASGNWTRAQQLAQRELEPDEARELLASYAAQLKAKGDLRHAEMLLAASERFDEAIGMYRDAGMRQDVIRLVAKFRPELLKTTHAHLAKELESVGKPKEAEEHFIGAGDWRGAVAAYRAANMWEDALRVAKKESGDKAAQQVALMWARSLAPELGARLLSRLGYLDSCLQLAAEAGLFDWSLEIARYADSKQQREAHYRYAMALEDEGRFADAEREFLKAGKAMEAVQMYIHTRDWKAAENVAQDHCPEGLSQVLVAKASEAAENQDFATAESLLLRAHKPEIIINHYKNAGMWSEAMRVCREYLPSQEAALRRELGQRGGIQQPDAVLEEARSWLEVGELRAALDILMREPHPSREVLSRAAEIILQRAEPELAAQVGPELAAKLLASGEQALAAQVYLQADRIRDAVSALASIGDWDKAKRIVNELAPDLEIYLDDLYREAMIKEGQVENLARVDVDAALDILVRKGQWSQVFETAKSQGASILHRYVAQRAAQLLKSGDVMDALELYTEHGTPPISQNFNLYYHLSERVLNSDATRTDYSYLAKLRNMLLNLTKGLEGSSASTTKERFEHLLRAAHYSAVRCVARSAPGDSLTNLVLKTSVSLLRYSDIILADRAYYEAGNEARAAGLGSEAFVFLNHFLDLEECVDEGDGSVLDVDDLRVTDFPLEVPLPPRQSISREDRESAREWLLTASVDQKLEQGLPLDQRGVYVGSLTDSTNSVPALPECALTGYPVRGSALQFGASSRFACRDDWNKLNAVARQYGTADSNIADVIAFVQLWCGPAPTFSPF
ncbi:hypothetical protein QAD02_006239, partial [Eretmocerus hayati]